MSLELKSRQLRRSTSGQPFILFCNSGTLLDGVGAHVGDERAQHSDRIDAEVMAEANVFGGAEGVADVARNLICRVMDYRYLWG